MDWATFWAIFWQTHLVTLSADAQFTSTVHSFKSVLHTETEDQGDQVRENFGHLVFTLG
jgi:hypothetical protein